MDRNSRKWNKEGNRVVQPLTGERMRGVNGRRNDGAVAKDFCTNFNFLFAPSITERWKIGVWDVSGRIFEK